MTSQQGEKLEHDNQFKAALAKYRFAGSLIEELHKSTSRLAARDRGISGSKNQRSNLASAGQRPDTK